MTLWIYGASIVLNGSLSTGMQPDGGFPTIAADILGTDYVNRGIAGGCNHEIFLSIVKDVQDGRITASDSVDINWTYIDRMYCALTKGSILPSHTERLANPVDRQVDHKIAKLLYEYMYDDDKGFADVLGYVCAADRMLAHANMRFTMSGMHHIDQPGTDYGVNIVLLQQFKSHPSYLDLGWPDIDSMMLSDFQNLSTPCYHLSNKGHQLLAELLCSAFK